MRRLLYNRLLKPSGANPICATNVTCIFFISIFKTCPPPYADRSLKVLSLLSFNEPPCHCTKGQLTTVSDGVTANSPIFCADSISASDFSSVELTPCFHSTLLTLHNRLYGGSTG